MRHIKDGCTLNSERQIRPRDAKREAAAFVIIDELNFNCSFSGSFKEGLCGKDKFTAFPYVSSLFKLLNDQL